MKKNFIHFLLIALLPTLFLACSSDNSSPIDPIEGFSVSTDINNTTALPGKGTSFFLQIRTSGDWVASSQDAWCTIGKKEGTGNASTICTVSANTGSARYTTITVTSNGKSKTISIAQLEGNGTNPDPDPNPNPDPNPGPQPTGYAGRIEIPKLNQSANSLFITHTTQSNGKDIITYSFEYDCIQKSSRWVAFTFNTSTPDNNVGRAGNFSDDPDIPTQYRTHNNDYSGSGYSRGHLAASSDRQYSVAANKQTFYMSNMNPQIQNGFNGGIWATLEQKVQSWGNITNNQDTLYVAKGGTIDNGNIIEYIKGNTIPVPKYFYMAILSLKSGQYKAVGFWFEHKTYSNNDYASHAISIDELEQKTGIDFFPNLPDNIENEVERSFNRSDWGL